MGAAAVFVGNLITLFPVGFVVLCIVRIIASADYGLLFVSSVALLGELTPAHRRGSRILLACCGALVYYTVAVFISDALSNTLNVVDQWKFLIGIEFVPLIFVPFARGKPSPCLLVDKNQPEEALAALQHYADRCGRRNEFNLAVARLEQVQLDPTLVPLRDLYFDAVTPDDRTCVVIWMPGLALVLLSFSTTLGIWPAMMSVSDLPLSTCPRFSPLQSCVAWSSCPFCPSSSIFSSLATKRAYTRPSSRFTGPSFCFTSSASSSCVFLGVLVCIYSASRCSRQG